jgi:meso-butanediol dehydrogenase / (S,S)-butanediol dehydrogenase / diacetyl reductase
VPQQDLAGKVALITGASSGIGAAIAHRLSEAGVHVALASRSGSDIGIEGSIAQSVDVRDQGQLDALVAAAVDKWGRLDILVANAGVGHYGSFLDVPADRAQEMIDVNFSGVVNSVRAALPELLKREHADILSVASEAGRRGLPGEAAYSGSKFGQVGFIRAMDHELRPQGIRATNLCPGGVSTEFAIGHGRGREKGMDMLDGMMRAEDIADLAEFVLTRPPHYRILEVALRAMTEESWG